MQGVHSGNVLTKWAGIPHFCNVIVSIYSFSFVKATARAQCERFPGGLLGISRALDCTARPDKSPQRRPIRHGTARYMDARPAMRPTPTPTQTRAPPSHAARCMASAPRVPKRALDESERAVVAPGGADDQRFDPRDNALLRPSKRRLREERERERSRKRSREQERAVPPQGGASGADSASRPPVSRSGSSSSTSNSVRTSGASRVGRVGRVASRGSAKAHTTRKPTADRAAREEREEREDAKLAARAAAKERQLECRRLELDSFEALPKPLRDRRRGSVGGSFVEYIDAAAVTRLIPELERGKDNATLTEAQRKVATYLYNHLSEWMGHLQKAVDPICALPPTAHARAASLRVLPYSYQYFSRDGGGRRYTTMQRRQAGKPYASKLYKTSRGDELYADEYAQAFGLQGCPRALRQRLCGAFVHDLDMKSAHPTIAIQLRDHLLLCETDAGVLAKLRAAELTCFKDYVRNRDAPGGWIERLCEKHDIRGSKEAQKDCIKRLLTRLMFGGSVYQFMKEPYGLDPKLLPRGPPDRDTVRVQHELAQLRTAIFATEQWSPFVTAELARHKAHAQRNGFEFDAHRAERGIFSRLLQTIENDILQVAIDCLQRRGWHVSTLIYDGCHVLHRTDANVQDALRQVEAEVLRVTGYRMEWTEKPLYGLQDEPLDYTRG